MLMWTMFSKTTGFWWFQRLVLWCAEIRLRPAVVILWGGIEVTVMMVVVVLRGGVVVVVVVVVTVDIRVRKEERSCGRRRVLGGGDACRQSSVALDGTVPTRCAHLRSAGGRQKSWDIHTIYALLVSYQFYQCPKYSTLMWNCSWKHVFLPSPIGPVAVSGQIVITIITPRIVKEIGSGAETMAVDHPSGGLRVVQNINAVCTHEIPQIILCFSMSLYQVLVGPLDSEENYN